MSDDIRSLIRAAQEAEGRREPLEAAGYLQRAAERLERAGKPARAVQLLRHAVRLSADEGLARHLEALERDLVAAGPSAAPVEGRVFELDEEDADGELPFQPPPGTPGTLNPVPPPPRGELNGHRTGVGRGPAPVEGAPRLELVGSGGEERPATAQGGPESPARTYRSDAGVGGLLLAHHVPVLGQVEVALAEGMRVVLLLGPQGSGRSTCLSALAARLGGVIVGPPFAVGFPPAELLLIDDAHRLEPQGWAELERALRARPKMRLVLAAPRSTDAPTSPSLIVSTGAGEAPLWTTAELLQASPGLPPQAAGRVEQVVEVALPLPAQLERLARELLTTHRPQLRDPGAVAEVLVEHTLGSPRGLHELISLVHRLPMDVQAVHRSDSRAGSRTSRGARAPASETAKKVRATKRAGPSSDTRTAKTSTPAKTRGATERATTSSATRTAKGSTASQKAGASERATTAGATQAVGTRTAPTGASKRGKKDAANAPREAKASKRAPASPSDSRGRARNTSGTASVAQPVDRVGSRGRSAAPAAKAPSKGGSKRGRS